MVKLISCSSPDLNRAAHALKDGRLVVFPTETVYGLGADSRNEMAVGRIYEVKGRPKTHPLIVHVSSFTQVEELAIEIPKYARELGKTYWPGPLTLILKKNSSVSNSLTGGQDTVAIRIPSHKCTLKLLKKFENLGGIGVAAPSANKFSCLSPTSATAVISGIGELLESRDLIIDGGECEIGLESTIINCTGVNPEILRPGAVTPKMISNKLGLNFLNKTRIESNQISFPGMFISHYAPSAKVFLSGDPKTGDGFIAFANIPTPPGVIRLLAPRTRKSYAKNLYSALRTADLKGIKKVYVVPPPDGGISEAIIDRLLKMQ
jgi:L-threonylcarbamoyladenylate synthase